MKEIRVHRLEKGTLRTEAYHISDFCNLKSIWTEFPREIDDIGMVSIIEDRIKKRIIELRELKSAVDKELLEMKELYERVKARR
jgi:hypothetical protein